MATPRTTAAALIAAALTLIATACSGGNPAEALQGPEAFLDHRTDPPQGSPPPTGAAREDPPPPPVSGGGGAEGSAGAEEGREPREPRDEVTVRRGGTELVVGVRELVSGGATVELVLRIHNGGGADSPAFAELVGSDEGMAAVELVDAANGRVHRVARDSSGGCVCSDPDPALVLRPGDSVELSATFAAPPEDVRAMDVRVPLAGTFTGVRVVRG
ncbi:hypothetical protein MRI28_27770 [Nocardiopsis dassonvillei]|uniref:hypothetical protein n=1 Tax=Nocardiopsis dassonvillei TaxID=2014 RepID=UPI00200C5B42|nr:hypothetical protein [Nocardiopsis dassonvillei]MCK9873375.1 hypothetical protein [Nocardiopsis dassonvillei]